MEKILELIVFMTLLMAIKAMWGNGIRPSVKGAESAISHSVPAPAPIKGCWAVLEIEPTTDRQAIKRAYRRLVKQYHPDVAGHSYNLKCARITEAYREALRSV